MTDLDVPDPYLPIHYRLIDGDPTAPADLAGEVLQPLLSRMRRRHPELAHDTLLHDAVIDAVLSYAERPEQFGPGRSPLLAYLSMSANGDILNALARRTKEGRREVSLQVVEDSTSARKTLLAHGQVASADDIVIERLDRDRLFGQIRAAARSPRDAAVLQLLVEGERRTQRFAAALGVAHLESTERSRPRTAVKAEAFLRAAGAS